MDAIEASAFGAYAVIVAGYLTHVAWAINLIVTKSSVSVGLGIIAGAGTFVPPVGFMHGIMLWFGMGGGW